MKQEVSFTDLVGKPCPVFARDSSKGKMDLKACLGMKPLALLFLPDLTRADCVDYTRTFSDNYKHYRALNTIVMIITTGPTSGMDLPLAVIGQAQEIFEQFGAMIQGSPAAGVLLVDRYGQVRYAQLAPNCSELPAESHLAKLLMGYESLCPECGVPEEHWAVVE